MFFVSVKILYITSPAPGYFNKARKLQKLRKIRERYCFLSICRITAKTGTKLLMDYIYIYIYIYAGVGKSRFTVVRMEKDMQVMIITIAKIDKS
jgi:hypothetical protein